MVLINVFVCFWQQRINPPSLYSAPLPPPPYIAIWFGPVRALLADAER